METVMLFTHSPNSWTIPSTNPRRIRRDWSGRTNTRAAERRFLTADWAKTTKGHNFVSHNIMTTLCWSWLMEAWTPECVLRHLHQEVSNRSFKSWKLGVGLRGLDLFIQHLPRKLDWTDPVITLHQTHGPLFLLLTSTLRTKVSAAPWYVDEETQCCSLSLSLVIMYQCNCCSHKLVLFIHNILASVWFIHSLIPLELLCVILHNKSPNNDTNEKLEGIKFEMIPVLSLY